MRTGLGPSVAAYAVIVATLGSGVSVAAADGESGLAALDANSDRMISRQEAANGQLASFRAMDRNNDGVLNREELKASQPVPEDEAKPDKAVAKARAQALKQWFANLDGDDNGEVSLAEYQAAMTPYFDRLDADGNGVIDGGELRRAYEANSDAAR